MVRKARVKAYQRSIPFTISVAAVLAAGIGVPVPPVVAQTLRPAIVTDGPLPPLRRPAPRRPDPQVLPEPEVAASSRPPRAAVADEPGAAPDGDEDEALAPTGLRPALRDGIAEHETGPLAAVDGPEAEPATYDNPDGTSAAAWDARTPEDAAVIERPPAGYDPELYRAEIGPLVDRRPERLYRFEPWQQRGIRVGSFVALPSVDVGAAWLSNVFRSHPPRWDIAFDLRPTLRLVSAWRTHALELRATGGLSYFDRFASEDDRAWQLEARGRLDVTRQTSVAGLLIHDVAQESRGTLEHRLRGGPRADVITDQAAVDLRHQFNRLTIGLRASVLTREVADTTTADGLRISNRDRNLTATEEAVRATWTFKPTLQGFVETAVNQRELRAAPMSDGISRNSSGERVRLGVGFGNTSQIVRGEASVGWGQQRPDDRRLAPIDGVIVDANIAWRIDAMNALLLRANTDVIETASVGSSGGFLRRGSVEWRHAFLKPLIGTVSTGHSITSYQSIALSESLTDIGAGLEYHLAPEAMVFGRWQHSIYRTTALTGGWEGAIRASTSCE